MDVMKLDTRHGTKNDSSFSHGNCLPLTATPHPMNYFAPQTSSLRGSWWFHPEDEEIEGIRVTHQASPWIGDFSTFLMQPIAGVVTDLSVQGARSAFDKEQATFTPCALSAHLARFQTSFMLVPSRYGAKIMLDYGKENAGLLFHFGEKFELIHEDAHEISGWVSNFVSCEDAFFKMYFSFHFEQPLTKFEQSVAYFGDIKEQQVSFATSFISVEQAKLNRTREQLNSFSDTKNQAKEEWQNVLDKIEVKHQDTQTIQTFYQNMYRAFLFPTCFYEWNEQNEPIHYQTKTKTVEKGFYYTNNGFWDTAKTVYPLYSLIATDKLEEMLEGYLNVYREVGYLSKWLAPDERGMMPGVAIDTVLADCLMKGIRTDLAPEFFEAMEHGATQSSEDSRYGRACVELYNQLGYVPNSFHESVNQTLDNALSDFSLAKVAQFVGDFQKAEKYAKHSLGYRTLIDKETGLVRSKDEAGQFKTPFSTIEWGGDYTEGSAWQNSFLAVHDIYGYIETLGGRARFSALLDELVDMPPVYEVGSYGYVIHEMSEMAALCCGQVAISNQPSFNVPYLYHFTKEYNKSERLLKKLMTEAFSSGVDGYPGDEDNGSMACWYLFSSLGFYPFTPATNHYVIGISLFDEAKIHLSNGNVFTVSTENNDLRRNMVERLQLNEEKKEDRLLSHHAIMEGGTLRFKLAENEAT